MDLRSFVQGYISELVPYFGCVDVRLSALKIEREQKSREMYNLITNSKIDAFPASTMPTKVIGFAKSWAKRHHLGSSCFIKAGVNYEGKKSSTEEFQKTDVNKVYWMAKEIDNVDKKFLVSKSLANSIRLQSKVRGYGVRVSSLPITTFPFWVRNHCYPINGARKFFYFDVSCAEFAYLLLNTNYNKYKSLVLNSDLYLWVGDALGLSVNRQLIKQMTMALVCGATYKAVMNILKINKQDAKDVVAKFWALIPDVYEFLEDTLISVKLFDGGQQLTNRYKIYNIPIKLSNLNLINKIYIRVNDPNDPNDPNDIQAQLRCGVYASIVRDSFLAYYLSSLNQLFIELKRFKLSFAWVDSCLIPINDNYDVDIILNKLKQIFYLPLKVKYGIGVTWGKVSLDEKNQKILQIGD